MYFFKKFIPENISSVRSHIISISRHEQQFFRTDQCCRVLSELVLCLCISTRQILGLQNVPLQRRMLNLFIGELVHI